MGPTREKPLTCCGWKPATLSAMSTVKKMTFPVAPLSGQIIHCKCTHVSSQASSQVFYQSFKMWLIMWEDILWYLFLLTVSAAESVLRGAEFSSSSSDKLLRKVSWKSSSIDMYGANISKSISSVSWETTGGQYGCREMSHGMKFSVYKVFFLTLICTLSFSPFSWLPSGHIVKNFSTLLVSISSSEDWWADIRTNKKILTDRMEKIKSTKALIYRLSIRLRWWGWGRWCHGAEDGCEEL